MPIEKLTTDDMRAAAALMSKGFPLLGGSGTERPGIIAFDLLVDASRRNEAEALLEQCDRRSNTYNLTVHLGDYERAWGQLKRFVDSLKSSSTKENGDNGNGRDPAGGGIAT